MTPIDEAAPGRRMTKRRAQTQARLISAAAAVFTEKGFGRSTVEDVCERAGYSRGAFYSNFDSLDELFIALYAERAAAVAQAAASAVTAALAENAPASAQAMMARAVAALPVTRETHLLNLEFTIHALRHPAVAAAFAAQRLELRRALIPLLRNGLQTGEGYEREFDELARVIIAMHEGLFLQELLEPDDAALPVLRQAALARLVDRPDALLGPG